ncbi:zinc finger MYM-type protein 4 isoform X2 [Kryptolebias marmoratus]|uniref:zinc finger MYM-type protein 4 isoform X2 n=1 Tax=Kryptolebias marmoratus TaxID=37003 RepID=UPI0018ACDDA6|nr:zinc finger MYM-type protein 4 isoform X2 [Kryptolebias marmoratus]
MEEIGDGAEHRATNQVSSDQAAVTEENNTESKEDVLEPGTSADVGDPESVRGSSPTMSEEGKQENAAAGTETESKETNDQETVTAASSLPAVSTDEPSEPAHSAESTREQEDPQEEKPEEKPEEEQEEKPEEEQEVKEPEGTQQDQRSEDTPAGANMSEDSPSDQKEDGTKEDGETQESSSGCKPSVSREDDLDEMMDIGTVDQMEQEAQMKEGEQSSLDSSLSPTELQTVIVPNSAEDEADVKPSASDLIGSGSPPSSDTATSTGRDSSSPVTMLNGMKVVELSLPALDDNMEAATPPIKSSPPPSPPLAKVKDEPMDEEYERALVSSTSSASVKDEPQKFPSRHKPSDRSRRREIKEDLQIGSVFSVTPSADALSQSSADSPTLHMSCSFCRKNLLKGQTAFQRKGSPALFCSTSCLTTSLPSGKGASKVCNNCQKLIFRPQDIILAPDAKGAMKDFCSQSCLTSFNYKKHTVTFRASAASTKTPQTQSVCSMCSRISTSKHEVVLSGTVHRMCSDACFNRFRTVNNLTMAGCANCGSFCHSKPLLLKMDDGSKTLCNSECLALFKEKTKLTQMCTMCRAARLLAQMVDNRNSDDSVNLFCSSSCVMAFKVQSVSSSGTRVNCDYCGKNTVPSYHLAMSDTSIRNFCSLPCVMTFQEKFKKSQVQLNASNKAPVGSPQPAAVTPQPDSKELQNLSCFQCSRIVTSKPELIQIKDKMVFLCSSDCSMEYKKTNFVTSLCEYCKIEKITREAKRIDNKDCYFCSDGCKLLFRHELSKNWGKHCLSCVYCHSMSKKLVTAQYGGSIEEFCSEECRAKYTMLFCHVAKCDGCGRKGKLKQNLPLLGEVKHFCGLSCLLRFCCDKVAMQGEVPKVSPEDTPVIASVMSLADQQAGKASNRTAQQSKSSNLQSKKSGHISTQTEAVKSHPPSSAPKILKNKALLCRPLVQNKGVSCKTQTADVEAQTDDAFPKVLVLPVPVPVFLPVPMNMYSQYAPKAVGLPLPLPVPMFLPVTMNSAERIVETIQEIKQKIPSNPFEAELILMAEMVAEDDDKQEPRKEKTSGKEPERQEAAVPDDHISNYSDDLDTDDLASFLNNWEDPSSDAGLKLSTRPDASEKLNRILDSPVSTPSEPYSEPSPPAMDIETDFTVETLERMARLRENCTRSPSPPPVQQRRRQAHRKAREKRGRKLQRAAKADEESSQKSSKKTVAAEIQKLKSQYGVDAWKHWILWRQTQPNLEQRRLGSRPLELREDILRCTTAELSYGLCCFIKEVKRPNGEPYSPDSLFYLCLGIQQYLFENGRVENIFMDPFYSKFSSEITNMLRDFKPTVTSSGYIHSRVEEEFLWGCKQLGAYSPIVLLNTLLFFCCKHFGFTTVEQHRQLSFAHVMRCTKTNSDGTKTTFLRFYPPIPVNEAESDSDAVPAKKRKEDENKEEILEMMENTKNPLRCPVRLYEFYLSKCSESVKQRTNMFYLHPERCCVPNSPLWFSSTPLDDGTMEAMLTRILTVRELHLQTRKDDTKDPSFLPDEDEDDSE